MAAFPCCGYFFSYYHKKFDHKAKSGRLLITFTFPSVFFENHHKFGRVGRFQQFYFSNPRSEE